MAQIGTIAAIASVAATGISIASTLYSGKVQRDAANTMARQEQARGDAEFAATQRTAQERELEARLILSRQQAAAAASGAGSDDPTIVRLLERTAERGQYGKESTLYSGKQVQGAYYDSAAARRRSGQASFLGSIFSAAGSLAGGVGDFARMNA